MMHMIEQHFEDTPDTPDFVEISFVKGVPVTLNGKAYDIITANSRFKCSCW